MIGLAGHHLTIGTAIFIDTVYADTLITVDLLRKESLDETITQMARLILAVQTAGKELREYYTQLTSSAQALEIPPPPYAPNPTTLSGNPPPQLRYTGKLDLDGTKNLLNDRMRSVAVFVAELADSGNKVVVKFATIYCEEAHRLLAAQKLAPTLHFCECLHGGLWMVVMDFVEGKAVSRVRTPPMVIYEKMKEAVDLLHAHDFVFGDLRGQNMIFNEADVDAPLKLIDFDITGRAEETRYPATLGCRVNWPPGMEPGMPMMKEHDLFWLAKQRSRTRT